MYANDSFFSLSTAGSFGLAVLSLVMVLGVGWFCWRAMRGLEIGSRALIAFVAFVVFVWVSPQIYYTYYIFLFEDLPIQWVARWPAVSDIWALIRFDARATLSNHGKGLLFWALIILALVPRGLRR